MSKKKNPTNKDRDNAINNLIGNQNWFKTQLDILSRLFDAYIGFNKNSEEFTVHLQKLKADFEASQAKEEAKNDEEGDAKSDEKVVEPSSAS